MRGLRGQFHEEGTYPGITDLMSQLAVTGFAPVDRLTDPRAERLSELHIAARRRNVSGHGHWPSRRRVWLRPPPPQGSDGRGGGVGLYTAGLVPTSQMSRMLIMLKLEELETQLPDI